MKRILIIIFVLIASLNINYVYAKKDVIKINNIVNNSSKDSSKVIGFDNPAWIISQKDYFSNFIDWEFIDVNGLYGDHKVWLFKWVMQEAYYIEPKTFDEEYILIWNPISKVRNIDLSNETLKEIELTKIFNDFKGVGGFNNYGDFVSDCSRLEKYPITVLNDNGAKIKGLNEKIDLLNNDEGFFYVIFEDKYITGVELKIGFKSTLTYSSTNNALTCIGGTEDNPITFWDLWNYTTVNNLNVSCQTCENATKGIGLHDLQYLFTCKLIIGDGLNSTFFWDKKVQVTFHDVTSSSGRVIEVKNLATFRLGQVENEDLKITSGTVSIIIDEPSDFNIYLIYNNKWYSLVQLYNCIFTITDDTVSGYIYSAHRVYNTMLSDGFRFYNGNIKGDSKFYNVYVTNCPLSEGYSALSGEMEKLNSFSNLYGFRSTWYSGIVNFTITDLKIRNCTYALYVVSGLIYDTYLIDPDFDNWVFRYGDSPDPSAEVYRQYSLDLNITDREGNPLQNVNVTINKNGNGFEKLGSWLTGSNGAIETQIITCGHYNVTGGNTIYSYNPYQIILTKSGYEDYDTLIKIDETTSLTIALNEGVWSLFFVLSICALTIGIIAFIGSRRED